MIRFVLAFVVAFCFCAAVQACPPPQPAPQPAPPVVHGQLQPIYATPVRTAVWRAVQPRAYYVQPVAPVPVAPVPQACPHCRRY